MPDQSSDDPSDFTSDTSLALRDSALEKAIDREAWRTTVRLALAQARALHQLQDFRSACKHAELAIDACRQVSQQVDWRSSLERDALDLCALEHFYLNNFARASRYIASAVRSSGPSAQASLVVAGFEWTAALIERWRAEPFLALKHALRAFDIYLRLDSPLNVARLRIVLADIVLDIAATFSEGTGIRARYLDQAAAYLTPLFRAGAMPDDDAGYGMACLTYARFSRMGALDDDRISHIESVGGMAATLKDLPLVGQVYTALADEHLHRGELGAAWNRYVRAIELLRQSDAPVLAIWPQRTLLQLQELYPRP